MSLGKMASWKSDFTAISRLIAMFMRKLLSAR